jgi:hypothetical protein
MSSFPDRVTAEVRGLRAHRCRGRHAEVVVARCGQEEGPIIAVKVGPLELPDLVRELAGEETARCRALALLSSVAEVCGGRLSAACLIEQAPGMLGTTLEIALPFGAVHLPTQPGEALAASVLLGLPLLADRSLFEPRPACERPSEMDAPPASFGNLSRSLQEFLASLDAREQHDGTEDEPHAA